MDRINKSRMLNPAGIAGKLHVVQTGCDGGVRNKNGQFWVSPSLVVLDLNCPSVVVSMEFA